MEPEGSLPHLQVPATWPVLSQIDPVVLWLVDVNNPQIQKL